MAATPATWSVHLLPLLHESLRRLEALSMTDDVSPTAVLHAADALAVHGALLTALAHELQVSAHDDLGRYAAEVADAAGNAPTPAAAATAVAEAFLRLHDWPA